MVHERICLMQNGAIKDMNVIYGPIENINVSSILDMENWLEKNKLGNILMEIRNNLAGEK